jgi:hypothetical protein
MLTITNFVIVSDSAGHPVPLCLPVRVRQDGQYLGGCEWEIRWVNTGHDRAGAGPCGRSCECSGSRHGPVPSIG